MTRKNTVGMARVVTACLKIAAANKNSDSTGKTRTKKKRDSQNKGPSGVSEPTDYTQQLADHGDWAASATGDFFSDSRPLTEEEKDLLVEFLLAGRPEEIEWKINRWLGGTERSLPLISAAFRGLTSAGLAGLFFSLLNPLSDTTGIRINVPLSMLISGLVGGLSGLYQGLDLKSEARGIKDLADVERLLTRGIARSQQTQKGKK